MKYESNILKRLIDTYGVVGNPRYISEIIKEFIIQGKERYPELFTYQADWLAHIDEFGLNPTYTVSYTGQSIYAPNTLERPVKSAILKGQTLVNLSSIKDEIINPSNTGKTVEKLEDNIKPNTSYICFVDIKSSNKLSNITYNQMFRVENEGKPISGVSGDIFTHYTRKYFKFTTGSTKTLLFVMRNAYHDTSIGLTENTLYIKNVVLLEYQEGMENWNIPYFTGMQSVKMPLLTTSNEDGTKTNILTVNEPVELRGIGDVQDEMNLLTGELTRRIGEVILDGSEDWFGTAENYRVIIPNVKGYKELKWGQKSAISNLYPPFEGVEMDSYIISEWEGNQIRVHDINTTLEELKTKLAEKPLHVIFISNEDSVKTVDSTILDQNGQNVKQLMSFNGGTHFITGSLEGSLIPSVSVSVETDLEETLKVCSLEGNTM